MSLAFLGELIAWLGADHGQERAINDYLPADGEPPLIQRYAAPPQISDCDGGVLAMRKDSVR